MGWRLFSKFYDAYQDGTVEIFIVDDDKPATNAANNEGTDNGGIGWNRSNP